MLGPRRLLGLLAILVPAVAGAAEAPRPCAAYGTSARVGSVPAELRELSGLAASQRHPGVYWAHNDSGNALELYALHQDGSIVARFPLRARTARDPEDIAVGPCSAGSPRTCIYLADIGDNGQRRQQVQIYKVAEPDRLRGGALTAETFTFTYEDGPRNAEAILVDPRTARVFVVTKKLSSLGDVYRIDGLGGRSGGTAVRVRTLRRPREFDSYTTSAAVHPSGQRVLLRTYGRVWELRAPDARAFEDLLDAEPTEVPSASQPQGEAVTYTLDAPGYLLGSEGVGSAIVRVSCTTP